MLLRGVAGITRSLSAITIGSFLLFDPESDIDVDDVLPIIFLDSFGN
jgi:hypothetical protein